jgi:creatinine amidohydrolase
MDHDFKWLNAHRPTPYAWTAQDLHPSGAVGDAAQATAEKGRALLEHGARGFCELLTDVEKFELKLSGNQ